MINTKIIAFDFCGTIAELTPNTATLLCEFIHNRYQIEIDEDLADVVVDRVLKSMPYYSSVKIKNEEQRRNYYLEFNSLILEQLGFQSTKSCDLYDFFRDNKRHWEIKSSVKSLLDTLRKRGYKLIVVSNFDGNLEQLLIENEIRDFFSDLFVSAIIGLEKPSKSFYDYVITSLGCESQEILMVGDDLVLDVYPAISVGITAIHLKESASFDTVSFDSQAHKYVTISDLSDLLEILI